MEYAEGGLRMISGNSAFCPLKRDYSSRAHTVHLEPMVVLRLAGGGVTHMAEIWDRFFIQASNIFSGAR